MVFHVILICLILLIVLSLFQGLGHMLHTKRTDQAAMVKSLSFRIGLSLFLFIVLIVGWSQGWWMPHRIV